MGSYRHGRKTAVLGAGVLAGLAAWGCSSGRVSPGANGVASTPVRGAAVSPRPLDPGALSLETMDDFADWIRIRDGEELYRSIPWHNSALDGIRASQRLDRPLLLWLYFGGPRGAC